MSNDGPDMNKLCLQGRLSKDLPEHTAIIEANLRYFQGMSEEKKIRDLYNMPLKTVSHVVAAVPSEPVSDTTSADVETKKRKKSSSPSTDE